MAGSTWPLREGAIRGTLGQGHFVTTQDKRNRDTEYIRKRELKKPSRSTEPAAPTAYPVSDQRSGAWSATPTGASTGSIFCICRLIRGMFIKFDKTRGCSQSGRCSTTFHRCQSLGRRERPCGLSRSVALGDRAMHRRASRDDGSGHVLGTPLSHCYLCLCRQRSGP